MGAIFDAIDPSAAAGMFVILLFLLCATAVYMMRDPMPFPRRFARRLHCPHQGRTCTVEFSAPTSGTVCSCSALPEGKLDCDRSCAAQL